MINAMLTFCRRNYNWSLEVSSFLTFLMKMKSIIPHFISNLRSAEIIHVCICFDEENLIPAKVLIRSILENKNQRTILNIHCITNYHDDFTLAPTELLGKSKILTYFVSESFEDLPEVGYISRGAYLRYLMPELVFQKCHRVIYLDCDIVVDADLCSLYNADLLGNAIGAVPDLALIYGSRFWGDYGIQYLSKKYQFADYVKNVLLIDDVKSYYNSGVLLIDTSRAEHFGREVIAFVKSRPQLRYPDQDALSSVMKGRIMPLALCYNCVSELCYPDGRTLKQKIKGYARIYHRERKRSRRGAKIVHFAGPNKPWLAECESTALEGLWWKYARLSCLPSEVMLVENLKKNQIVKPRIC